MAKQAEFYSDCVSWPRSKVHTEDGLCAMIDRNREITRRTFLTHVNRFTLAEIEARLGYSAYPQQGLTMAGDWAVTYHRSKVFGKTCYYFRHSGIEYVFI